MGAEDTVTFRLLQPNSSSLRFIGAAEGGNSAEKRDRIERNTHDALAHNFTGILMKLGPAKGFIPKKPRLFSERLALAPSEDGLQQDREAITARQDARSQPLTNSLSGLIAGCDYVTRTESVFLLRGIPRILPAEMEPRPVVSAGRPGCPTPKISQEHRRIRLALAIMIACMFTTQIFGLDSSKDPKQYVVRSWTSEQGLPQSSVNAILQTRDGLLWIGTRGGLAHFDGAEFTLYQSGAPNSLPGKWITSLAEGNDDTLWIGTNGGLSRYRDGHFQNYSTPGDNSRNDSIWRIAKDASGGIWAVTWRSELFHVDGRTVRHYPSPIPPRPREVNAILEDTHGTVWIATFDGLFAFTPGKGFEKFTRKKGLAGDRVYALALDQRNQLWVAGDGGLSRQTADHFVPIPVPGLAVATVLAFDPSGKVNTVWTGSTGNGLFRLSPNGTQRLRTAQGLLSDEVYLLAFSMDGSLWVGTDFGLNQITDGVVTSFTGVSDQPSPSLNLAQSQTPKHDLWFGHRRTPFDVRNGTVLPLGQSWGTNRRLDANSLATDNPLAFMGVGSVWIRTRNRGNEGLILAGSLDHSVFTGGVDRLKRTAPHIPWGSVDIALIDHDGTIWTAGSDIAVVAYSANDPPRSFTTANGLDDDNVGVLKEDAAGDIWVGTIAGLNRIHHGIVTQVLSCDRVTAINPSIDGSLWVSSESGLIYVPPALAPIHIFTEREGLPTSIIEGLAEDTFGHLWLGTLQGIVRVNIADLLAFGRRPIQSPVVFGIGDGLSSAQLRANSIFRSYNGDIWFMTLLELAMVSHDRIHTGPLNPILIDRVDIDDHTVVSPRSLTVPPGHHRISIHYTVPEFQVPSRIRFRYRVDGWDENWIEAGSLHEATFTGLPPGRYTFRVTNSDGYGNWSSVEGALPLRVTPHFYQTGWFFVLFALLVGTGIWHLHRFRLEQVSVSVNARIDERNRIARDMHDTLAHSFTGILMQLEAAKEFITSKPAVLSQCLERATSAARDGLRQSRQAITGLQETRPQPLTKTLPGLVSECDPVTRTESVFLLRGVPRIMPAEIERQMFRICQEAYSNARRYSGATKIEISLAFTSDAVVLAVNDDGKGFAPSEAEDIGFGLSGMRKRAERIGAHLTLDSAVGNGTRVRLEWSNVDAEPH
jgi:ligand-binding sensor domain-containing protein/signal transduction histidine kinase